ncbi:YfhO family protein [Streptomyces sp. NPDC057445]|uniref:YfhO family protein n=1 Tax=Streptomyces sp. NPDC057445 TaxID=3346136 RepID=UPI0036BEB10B
MPPAAEAVPAQGERVTTTGGRAGTADEAAKARPGGPRRLLPRARRSVRLRAAGGAALLTCLVFCLSGLMAGSRPFGPRTRNIVDLGQQYLPYHAYWRKLLLGGADGDMFVNWNSGFGSNFLADFGTYLSSPFDLMVVFFPADRIELALYVITAAKITAAGAAMSVLLLKLRRGPWPVAAVLGAAYALSGWTFNYGASVPMWLDGLLAFPLLCLVGEWARAGRRPVLGPLVVALAWTANFYTAYMATIGAAVVLVVRLLTDDDGGRRRLTGLLRAVRGVAVGIGLAAPVVVVVYSATRVADPTPGTTFSAVAWTEVFARLLPATSSVATPALYIGTPALALALTLPFNGALAPRVRVAWTAAVCLVALSLQWEPTHLLWHAGASPNGIPYRQTFVLCGLLLIAAWLSTAKGLPRMPALLAAGALLAVMTYAARGSRDIDRWTYPAFTAATALAVVAAAGVLIARRYTVGARVLPVAAVALLLVAQAGETVATGARIERRQLQEVSWAPPLGPWHEDMQRATRQKDAWPRHRTDPGEVPGGNDVMVVGGQGADYYSSLTSEVYSSTLASMGFGYYAKGRHPVSLDNPVTDAIFSVGTRMHSSPSGPVEVDTPPEAAITSTGTDVPPLVTVRSGVRLPDRRLRFGDSAFANQEMLLGAQVYDVPGGLARRSESNGTITLTADCAAGSQVYFWAPRYQGTAALDGQRPVTFSGKLPAVQGAMQALGTTPSSGSVRIALHASAKADLPRQPVGCLVQDRLDSAVRRLTATGATGVHVSGHTISAELPPGSTGTAVIAAPRISGWTCAAGGADPTPAKRYLGLLAVPLDSGATSVSCTFRPPGLRLGGAVGATALAALVAIGILHRRSRRRPEVSVE